MYRDDGVDKKHSNTLCSHIFSNYVESVGEGGIQEVILIGTQPCHSIVLHLRKFVDYIFFYIYKFTGVASLYYK